MEPFMTVADVRSAAIKVLAIVFAVAAFSFVSQADFDEQKRQDCSKQLDKARDLNGLTESEFILKCVKK